MCVSPARPDLNLVNGHLAKLGKFCPYLSFSEALIVTHTLQESVQ